MILLVNNENNRNIASLIRQSERLVEAGLYSDAIELLDVAISKTQNDYSALLSKASILAMVGDMAKMLAITQNILERFPYAAFDVAKCLTYHLACNGEFLRAADELQPIRSVYEAKLESGLIWNGESSLSGKTVCVSRNIRFGHGTLMLLSRYLTDVAKQATYVIFEVPDGYDLDLKIGNISLVKTGAVAQLQTVDLIIPYTAMLQYFWREYDQMKKIRGYLQVCSHTLNPSSALKKDRLRVGICWRGSGVNGNKDRFLDIELLSILFNSNASFVSLQKRPTNKEFDVFDRFNIEHEAIWFNSWADTAVLMNTLDLVISVDTAVAHLAGVLGVPLWLLLPNRKEWHFYGDPPIWYESCVTYSQTTPGEWSDPISRIEHDLLELCQNEKI